MANVSTSKGRWSNLSKYASRIFFVLIFLQVPLFRVPCRSGMCSTPMEVTSSQLISSEIFPLPLVKAMLYPGAVANGLITSRTVPSWDNLLNIYNLTNVKEASAVTDLQRLEVKVEDSLNTISLLKK
uniref:Putative ovule protein n=1 Tax=Solanum chacoense TaxID=4108 RepID=A0A0V0HJT8_SOLCH